MIYLGLYSSAITISQDLALRHSIIKSAREQSKFLDKIGTAEMGREKVASSLSKRAADMEKESGLPPSLTNDEIKDYLESVLKEVKGK